MERLKNAYYKREIARRIRRNNYFLLSKLLMKVSKDMTLEGRKE